MKFQRITLIVLLIICHLSATSIAIGQSETTLSVLPAQSNVVVDGTTQIGLSVNAGQNIMAYDIVIEYDAAKVSLVQWEHGDYLSNLAVVYKVETPGLFHLACTQLATAPVSGAGNLLTLSFQGKSVGTSAITISQAEFSDALGNLTNPQIIDGHLGVITGSIATSTATLTPTVTPTSSVSPTRTATMTKTSTATPASPGSPTTIQAFTPTTSGNSTSTRPANPLTTPQARLTPTSIVQPTAVLLATELQNPSAVSPTAGTDLNPGQQSTLVSGMVTDPIVIPIRPDPTSSEVQEEERNPPNWVLILGIILFDILALGLILFLLLRRRQHARSERH